MIALKSQRLCGIPDFDRLWLVNVYPVHQVSEFFPRKVPDLGTVPWPPVPSICSETLIDHNQTVEFLSEDFCYPHIFTDFL